MSYLDWHVGMKVVCIDDAVKKGEHVPLIKGRVYTIRSFWVHPDSGEIGLTLVEVVNSIHPAYKMERGYKPARFRRVQPRTTDISIFTAMLTKPRVPA